MRSRKESQAKNLTTSILFLTLMSNIAQSIENDSNSKICPADNNLMDDFKNYGQCNDLFFSTCSLGDYFKNKVPEKTPEYLRDADINNVLRSRADSKAHSKATNAVNELQSLRSTLFKDMDNQTFTTWLQYIADIFQMTERVEMFNQGYGYCGEAAHYSIVHSLLNQLKTGIREPIHYALLKGSTQGFRAATHLIVIYNSAQRISNQNLNNEKLNTIFNEMQPENETRPVVICDSFAGFHGEAAQWSASYNKDKDSIYANSKWEKIEVRDCSLPSLRKGLNSKQRNFLKDYLINILTEAIRRPFSGFAV